MLQKDAEMGREVFAAQVLRMRELVLQTLVLIAQFRMNLIPEFAWVGLVPNLVLEVTRLVEDFQIIDPHRHLALALAVVPAFFWRASSELLH